MHIRANFVEWLKNGEGAAQFRSLQCFKKRTFYHEQWIQICAEETKGPMENPKVRCCGLTLNYLCFLCNLTNKMLQSLACIVSVSCKIEASSSSMKEELSLERLKGVKLWITAGPREKFTALEVMFQDQILFVCLNMFILFHFKFLWCLGELK